MSTICVGGSRTPGGADPSASHRRYARLPTSLPVRPRDRVALVFTFSLPRHTHDGTQQLWNRFSTGNECKGPCRSSFTVFGAVNAWRPQATSCIVEAGPISPPANVSFGFIQ